MSDSERLFELVASIESLERVSKVIDNFTMVCFDKCQIDYRSSVAALSKSEHRCIGECTTQLRQLNQLSADIASKNFNKQHQH